MQRTTEVIEGRIQATGDYAERCKQAAEYVESQRMPMQDFLVALNQLGHYEGNQRSQLEQATGLTDYDRDYILAAAGRRSA